MASLKKVNLGQAISNVRSFAERIGKEIEAAQQAPYPRLFDGVISFWNKDLGGISFSGGDAEAYRDLRHKLYQTVSDKMSEGVVAKLLDHAMLQMVISDNRPAGITSAQYVEFVSNDLKTKLLQNPKCWTSYIPICGITAPEKRWEIGKVAIFNSEAFFTGAISKTLENIISKGSQGSAQLEWHRKAIERDFGRYKHQPFASVESTAVDAEAAWQSAQRHLQFVLDCLNYIISDLHDDADYGIFTYGPSQSFCAGIVLDTEQNLEFAPLSRIAPHSLVLPANQLISNIDAAPHLATLLSWLVQPKPSEHQKRVLAAIHWAGRAAVAVRKEDAFLQRAIALESLILGRKDQELSFRLALCVTHLLGTWLKSRRRTFVTLKNLYAVRSKIVHSGEYEVIDSDLELLKSYVRTVVRRLLTEEPFLSMTGRGDLDDWFDVALCGDVSH